MSEEKTMQLDEFLAIDENIDIDESYQEKQDPEFQKIKLAEVGELCEAAEKQQILVQELSQKLKDEEAKLRELLEIKIPETLESVGLKELKLTSGKKIFKDELKIMCVLFTEDVGGILTLMFEEDGTLVFQTEAEEGDLLYDEIGSVLLVKKLQQEKQELMESLELYFKVFFLNEDAAALLNEGE